jgi:hypothetical protein
MRRNRSRCLAPSESASSELAARYAAEIGSDLSLEQTTDRSMLLWNALDSQQTRSYDQAVAVLEDLLAMDGNREMASHFRFPPNW